ncbi:MAG: class II glutamine amidotransferase [Ignisphaera sp.]
MCRILHFVGLGKTGNLIRVVRGFKLATQYDVILDRVRRGRRAHNHGWGVAYVFMKFGEMGFAHYKTALPLLDEDIRRFVKSIPMDLQWIHMVMHSRLTTLEPINMFNSHPFYINIPGKLHLWFAHNGSVNKNLLAKELGLEDLASSYADSFFIAYWIAKKVDSIDADSLSRTLSRLIEMGAVETSLNSVGIMIDEKNNKVVSFSLNYIAGEGEKNRDYYQLLRITPNQNSVVIASSTIGYYLKSLFGWRGEPLDNGEIDFIEIRDSSIELKRVKVI